MMIQPLRGSDVRQLNERIVMNLFYDYEKVSQSDIVNLTGLKPSTVLRIFNNLERDGDILMIDPESDKTKRSVVGRHPVYYRLNPLAHYTVGMTFAKDLLELVIVDFTLSIVYSVQQPFSLTDDIDSLSDKIAQFITDALQASGVPAGSVLGIGIGCPGNVEPDRGLLLSLPSEPGIRNYPLKEKLEAILGIRVLLQGSNQLAAQHYNRYSGMENCDRILYISIGSAVTASFYSRSPAGMIGGVASLPVGWMLMQRPDSIVNMREVRTLNSICSEQSILSAMQSDSMQTLDISLETPSPAQEAVIQNIGDALSFCISNLSMLFQPQLVVIASRSRRFSHMLARTTAGILDTRYYWPFEEEPLVIGKAHNFRKISRSAVDLVMDYEFGANLGWKRPQVLNQPQHKEEWDRHIKD